jgi:GntR family transcriptional regulator
MSSTTCPELVLEGGQPLDRQIREQIRDLILTAQLRPGEELPTVRAVAVGLAVSPSLVSAAYRWLEREGYLTTAEGSGAFVSLPGLPTEPLAERGPELEKLCQHFLTQLADRGLAAADALRLLEALIYGDPDHDL